MLMVENSTKTKVLDYESQPVDQITENNPTEAFENKLKSCIQQLSKNPDDTTIEKILSYSKSFRKL